MSGPPKSRRCHATALALLLTAALLAPSASACTSGVLQLIPPPQTDQFDPCISPDADSNSIKAICGAAYKVTVTNGIIRTVPLEQDTFTYSGPGPWPRPTPFNCKDMNASGLFNKGSTTAATLMLYDNLGGPLSNLTKTGSSRVSLTLGRTYSYKGPTIYCTYNYTVVSGCVLGAKAASAIPPPCPPGHALKTGRLGIKYCSPCPKGSYSPGGSAATAKCTPCPIGSASTRRGAAKCRVCRAVDGEYAAKPGLEYCQYCSAFENKWTDGKTKCEACPAGSFPSAAKPGQCVRCYAGKKCCTVGFGKDCPNCTSSATPATYTSIFALEATTPASCLATNYARCAPKINITIDGTCTMSINNMGNQMQVAPNTYCSWSERWGIKGASANAPVDLARLGTYYDSSASSLLNGNVTSAASPYLVIGVNTGPITRCLFRYRALTSPAAKLIKATPKPSRAPPSACPAGSYIDTTTDTKPGPCLPCPPGTYSTKPGTTTAACLPCPPGTYAQNYGSTRCAKCPPARVSQGGAAVCIPCAVGPASYPNPERTACTACPANTGNYYPGAGTCLGNVLGSVCCAAGVCAAGQPRCNGGLTPTTGDSQSFQSIFRLKSRSISGATCRNATLLSCLPAGAKLVMNTNSYGQGMDMQLSTSTRCATNASYTITSYYGGIAATNRALVSGFEMPIGDSVSYELLSDRAAGTLTMYLSARPGYISSDLVTPTPDIRKECSATFELLTGYFLDLQQPASAACPAAAVTLNTNGRTLCRFCGVGSFKNSTGACQRCPAGTYQPLFDGTACKPCPAGSYCYEGADSPQPCFAGSFSPAPRTKECRKCPAGTFTGYGSNKACSKCPKGTIAPKESSACGVPWAKTF